MANQANTLSRVLQITAIIIFIIGFWRLYNYFYDLVEQGSSYILYTVLILTVIGVGVLLFDEVYKPHDTYVGWAFLFGVSILSIILGIVFVFIPTFEIYPTTFVHLRVLILIILGVVILIESLAARNIASSEDHGVNSDTVAPLLLKTASQFTIAWGIYQLSWVLVANLKFSIDYSLLWQFLLLSISSILSGLILIIYVESEKRQPHFRARRLPLLISFLMLVTALPITGVSLAIPSAYLLPISFALGIALIIISFYFVYHPVKAR
jgi:hypothetical protein